MAKQANPFFDFDFTKMMDPSKFMDMSKFGDVNKMMGDMKMDGVMSSHQRNIDTITKANRLAMEGAQAIMQRQLEIMRQGAEDVSSVAAQMSNVTSPNERLARQAELCKDVYERSLSNMKELSEMASKSNDEVVSLLNDRLSEAMDEVKTAIEAAPDMANFQMPAMPGVKPAAKPAAKAAPAAKPAPAGA